MTRFALRNPHVVGVLALIVAVLGAVSYQRLPADLLPIFETPAVQVVTFYPGMPPEVMERDIMSRLERWTGQSVGISHQEGKSMLGVSIVRNFFREGTTLDTAMSQVTSYAISDMFYLPPGTIPPMVMPFDPTASVPLALVTVSSETMSETELYDVAYFELRNRLQSIRGVIAPAVYGGKLRRILAYVDRERLETRGLAPMDVVRALNEQNVFIPAGNLKSGSIDYQIFANSMPEQVRELNDVPVDFRDGSPVLLRDVGRVRDAAQIQSNVVRINGRRQVYIPIYRQPGANTIEIVDSIRSRLVRIQQRLREMDPDAGDVALGVVLDQSVYVRGSIQTLQVAGLLGAVFAGLVVLAFLRSLRSTLVVLVALPLGVLTAFVGLVSTGATLNAMTLGGLALVIGTLIDQSIVVVESIVRRLETGEGAVEAALEGAREVTGPLLISTVTFCIVFFPVTLLTGMASYLLAPVALAATFAMTGSFLFAITLAPALCVRILRIRPRRPETTSSRVEGVADRYRRVLAKLIRRRVLVLASAAGAFLVSLLLLTSTGSELYPRVDANQFEMFVRLPAGTRIERTEQVIAEIEAQLVDELGRPDPEYPDVERHPDSELVMLVSNIGVLMDWPAAYTPNTGPMDAFVLVQLKADRGSEGTLELVDRLRRRFEERFPTVDFSFDTGGMLTAALNMGEPAPIHVQVAGSSLEISHEIATLVAREVREVPGAVDVRIAQELDYPTIELDIDRIKAAAAGVDVEDVMKNLVTATNSSVNFDPAFWLDQRNGNHYFIGAQYAEADLVSIDTLRSIPVRGPRRGNPVPLDTLVDIRHGTGPSVVNHKNITRVIDVYAGVASGHDVGSVVADLEDRLARSVALAPIRQDSERGAYFEVAGEEFVDRGYSYTLEGEVSVMREAIDQFSRGFVLAVILIYLVMVVQFRSFLDPLIVLLAVPLGLVGVAVMLASTGTSMSIMASMGVIMMVGLVVSYSILLVDYANRRLDEADRNPEQAVIDAAVVRSRPILMTSLTTVLALAPMAIGGPGGEANAPLARTIIGGVLGAAGLSLVVVPCLYVVLKGWGAAGGPGLHRERAEEGST